MLKRFGGHGLVLLLTTIGCVDVSADSLIKNHVFEGVNIRYWTNEDRCSFQFSPTTFCDDRHIDEIKNAIATRRPDFNRHYILLSILERKEYFQRSLISIDTKTGIAYPFPFDFYSGFIGRGDSVRGYGHLSYTLNSNRVCITGAIVAYREVDSGKLCWNFDDGKFVGHRTPYTDP